LENRLPPFPKKQAKTDPGIAAEQYHFKLILLQIRITSDKNYLR
jgi:hypothetical protein